MEQEHEPKSRLEKMVRGTVAAFVLWGASIGVCYLSSSEFKMIGRMTELKVMTYQMESMESNLWGY